MNALDEARLSDFVIDLFDLYGNTFPRPIGNVVQFTVVHENAKYKDAEKQIMDLLRENGVLPCQVSIEPGAEMQKPYNRRITIRIEKSKLM